MERTSGSTSSTDASPEKVSIGRILGAHGLRGEVRARCDLDDVSVLAEGVRLELSAEGKFGLSRTVEIRSVGSGRGKELRLGFRDIDDRFAAEALVGREMLVEASMLPVLDEGEFYAYQLVGCRIEDEAGRPVGTVRSIWSTGAPDVLVLDDDEGHERMVPAALLREVDLEAGRAVIEVIPGLLDGQGPDQEPVE